MVLCVEEQALLNKISKGATFLLAGIVVSKLFTYLHRIIIARYLGADVYGLFNLGLAVIGIILSLVLVGLPLGLLRYISYYYGKNDNNSIYAVINSALKIILPLSLIFAFLLFIFAEKISLFFFHNESMRSVLKLLSFAIPVSALATCTDYILQAFQKVNYLIISRNIVEPILKVAASAIVIYLGYSLLGITAVYLFSLLITALLMAYFLKKMLSFKKILRAPYTLFRQMLHFSVPLMLSDIFSMLLVWSDTLILGYFVSAVQVGIYNAAVPTARLLHTIPVALRTLFVPTISGLYAQKKDFSRIYKTVSKWLFLIGLPSFILLSLYSKQMLSIFFGSVFAEGYIVLIFIALSFFIYSVLFTSESILLIMKKTKLILLNSLLTVFINIALNVLLIPKYGILGAAISTSASFLMMSLLIAIETYYFTKTLPFKWEYLKSVVSAAIPIGVILYFGQYISSYSLVGLTCLSIIYLALYAALLLVTHAFELEELDMIKAAWQKVRKKI